MGHLGIKVTFDPKPKDVMDTMTNYTGDPAAVLRWRDAMADLIESRP